MNEYDDYKRTVDKINNLSNERAIDIIFDNVSNTLQLKITEDIHHSFDFNDKSVRIEFNSNFYDLLKSLILIRKKDLIKLSNLYQKESRDFRTFFYDLIILIYFISKLPDEYQKLIQKDELQSAGDLMHNRILAQTVFYFKSHHTVKLIPKQKKLDILTPDLKIDDIKVDIKVLTGRVDWIKEDVSKFINKIQTKYQDAMNQTDNGIAFISFWSKNMNVLFREYFYGQYDDYPYPLERNSCYFILDGFDPLRDYYTSKYVYDLRKSLSTSNLILNYTPFNFPSRFNQIPIGRKNFSVSRSSSLKDCGISFSYG